MRTSGKIIKILANFYYVQDSTNKVWECFARTRMLKEGKLLMVGDRAEIEQTGTTQAVIVDLIPRKNKISKPNVANIDNVLVVFSTTEPDLDLYTLDRYLSFIRYELAEEKIYICINKIDLKKINVSDIYKNSGYEVFYVSALTKEGIDNLSKSFKEKITVLAGPSGTGKSSLIKALAPDADIKIGSLSAIKTGRHITRNIQLVSVNLEDKSGFLVDTPGFSQIDFSGLNPQNIVATFKDLYNIGCAFNNCLHDKEEEGCILASVENLKEFPSSRIESYKKILKEAQSQIIYGTKEEEKIKIHGAKDKGIALPKIDRIKREKSRKRIKQELKNLEFEDE